MVIENIGDQEEFIDTFSGYRLVDKDGNKYKLVWPSAAKASVQGRLGPGRKIAGEMAFAIPEGPEEFELEILEVGEGKAATLMAVVIILLVSTNL